LTDAKVRFTHPTGEFNMAEKIGIYVCHCGSNIAGTVDVEEVARWAGKHIKDVAVSRDYKFMCSSLGQQMIEDDIQQQGLTGVVVGACSPHLHEKTFRNTCKRAELNPYLFQMTNLREHVSWVNSDKESGTLKAKSLISAAAERVKRQKPLDPMRVKVNPATLVVGGGIAGLQAALELADAGHHVYLVERESSIGGHMAQFDKTFPTLDCSACILTPKMSEIDQHENVTLLTYSEVEEVSGSVGNFKVKIRRKARFVDEDKCTGCGQCIERCPVQHRPYDYPATARGDGQGYGLPVEPELEPEVKAIIDRSLELHRPEDSSLISVLQDINRDLGYLPEPALRYVSRKTNVSLLAVYHVATFYKAFSLTPRGKHVIRVCMGTACHVRGAPRVLEAMKGELGIEAGQTTEDRKFTLETVNCLGTCPLAPVVVADSKYYGNTTPARVKRILSACEKTEDSNDEQTDDV
jgi:NADH:ubiquinone oxidoreductase subunit E/NAD-dependent dihydropyrimidine dehydrogenase PreA subunit